MTAHRRRPGFTLVELLVVITILGILVALLVPVIAGAVNTANNARVTGEINGLSAALASFRNKYGDYPPSRVVLWESGAWRVSTPPTAYYGLDPTARMIYSPDYLPIGGEQIVSGNGDQSYAAITSRSIRFLRKFFPRMAISTTGGSPLPAGTYYDFNGNNQFDALPILLEGHECLAFFLGGIPIHDFSGGPGTIVGMSGFSRNPINPFIAERSTTASGSNREPSFYDFRAQQLIDDDHDGIPGYVDPLGRGDNARYFAYFSSNGGTGYDPNDTNLAGVTTLDPGPRFSRGYVVAFPVVGSTFNASNRLTESPLPNPYTSGPAMPVTQDFGQPATFINNQTYQIVSAGRDRNYGLGGAYLADATAERLPGDPQIRQPPAPGGRTPNEIDAGLRVRERDNLSSFSSGTLE